MQIEIALCTLAHRGRDVRMTCNHCGHTTIERIEFLIARFGPLYPLDKVAWNTKCHKCGQWDMHAAPLSDLMFPPR